MRYFTLESIKAEDNLALILNAYLKSLNTLDQLSVPRETMGQYMRLLRERSKPNPSEESNQCFDWRGPRFFMLQVLSNSFNDWHKNIGWAIKALTEFFEQYDGDLTRYAIENRMRVLEEYGSDDDADYNEDGSTRYRDDAASLAHYTLGRDLEQYFTGSDGSGEKIGTSHAADYNYFTDLVRRETEFSPFRVMSNILGQDLPVYRENEQGEMVERSLADRLEDDLNEEITNAHVVAWFELALVEANHCVGLHTFATTADHYRELLAHLVKVRDLDFPEPAVHL
ncbi:MAG: hypothetical protein ACRYFX_13105 [Janthinobacterium lividum]